MCIQAVCAVIYTHFMQIVDIFTEQSTPQGEGGIVDVFTEQSTPRGGGGDGRLTSYIWHSTDVWSAPFFQQKVYDWPHFFWIGIWKAPLFRCIIFCSEVFQTACSLGIQWIDCDICLTTSNKWVQKSKGSIWMHFRQSSIWIGPFIQCQVYEWGRFRNTGSKTCTTSTRQVTSPLSPHQPPSGCVLILQF